VLTRVAHVADAIHYAGTRYYELDELLQQWGYELVADPDFSSWQETFLTSPLTGHVKVTGRRDNGDGTHLTVKFEEFWVKGDLGKAAVELREGASLARYHYHGHAPNGGMRWCLYPEGHPHDPIHVHPFAPPEGGDPVACEAISPYEMLQEFERNVYVSEFGLSDEE
jgi:hypothetical protein